MRPIVLVFFAIYLVPIIFAQEKNTAVPVVVGLEPAYVQNDVNNNSKVDNQENPQNQQENFVQNDTAVDNKTHNPSIDDNLDVGSSNSQNNQSNNNIVTVDNKQNVIINNTSQNNETLYNLSSERNENTIIITKHYQNDHNNQSNVSSNVNANNEQEINASYNLASEGTKNNNTDNKYNNVELSNDQNTVSNETNNKGLGSYVKNEQEPVGTNNKYNGGSVNLNEENNYKPQDNQSKNYVNNTADNKQQLVVSYLKNQREYVVEDNEHSGEFTNLNHNEKNNVSINTINKHDNFQSNDTVNNSDNEQKQANDIASINNSNNKGLGNKQEILAEDEDYVKSNKNNTLLDENAVNKHNPAELANFQTNTNIEVHVKNTDDNKQKQAHDIESGNLKNRQEPNKIDLFDEITVTKHKPAGLSNFQDNRSTDDNNKGHLNDDSKNNETDMKVSKSNIVYDNVVRAVLGNKGFYFQNEQTRVGSGRSHDEYSISHNIQFGNDNQTNKSSEFEGIGYQNNKAEIRSDYNNNDQKEITNNNNQTKIYSGLLNENIIINNKDNQIEATNNEEYKLANNQNNNSDRNGPSLHIDDILTDDDYNNEQTETEIHTALVHFQNNHGFYNGVNADNSNNTFQDNNTHFQSDEIIENNQATTDGLYEIAGNKNFNFSKDNKESGNDNNDVEEDYYNAEDDNPNFKQEDEYNKISPVNRWQEKLEEVRKHIEKVDVAAREEERINFINKMIAYRVHVLENFRQKYGITIGCDSELCRLSCIIYWFKSGYCPKRSTCLCI